MGKKSESGCNIIIILLLLGRILSGENPDLKNEGGEEYKVVGNFIHTCLKV